MVGVTVVVGGAVEGGAVEGGAVEGGGVEGGAVVGGTGGKEEDDEGRGGGEEGGGKGMDINCAYHILSKISDSKKLFTMSLENFRVINH